jgi:hypothetical protein
MLVAPVVRLVLVAVFAAAVLTACGSSSGKSGTSGRCEEVPVAFDNSIASSLATGFTAEGFRAVHSHDGKKMWFVSAHGVDPSGNVIYPTWATDDLSGSGRVYSADSVSLGVTPALQRLPGASATTDGVAQSRDCARAAAGG